MRGSLRPGSDPLRRPGFAHGPRESRRSRRATRWIRSSASLAELGDYLITGGARAYDANYTKATIPVDQAVYTFVAPEAKTKLSASDKSVKLDDPVAFRIKSSGQTSRGWSNRDYTTVRLQYIAPGRTVSTVVREVARREEGGLVATARRGNTRLFRAVTDSVVYKPLADLLAVTFGPAAVPRTPLAEVPASSAPSSTARGPHGTPAVGPVPDDIDLPRHRSP